MDEIEDILAKIKPKSETRVELIMPKLIMEGNVELFDLDGNPRFDPFESG